MLYYLCDNSDCYDTISSILDWRLAMINREELKSDLLSLDPKVFYLKHIVKSHNWYFSDYLHFSSDDIIDKMDLFKEIVSKSLGINFHSLQIVGSAKTGYSLSPKKLFAPFHDETPDSPSSDIDIAIVSERLFAEYWNKLRMSKVFYNQFYYDRISKSIFRGYINDKDLLHFMDIRQEWEEMIGPINRSLQDHLGFAHPITYRLYRNWEDLEDYQLIGIKKARNELEDN